MKNEKYKIAVVDDEHEILNLLKKFLTRNPKYEVTTFSNPLLALSTIDKSYDLVFMDIMMPQMNGLDVLDKLIEKDKDLKVIMMTAFSTLDKVLGAHKQGAKHYIMKPFDSLPSIEKKITEVLNS